MISSTSSRSPPISTSRISGMASICSFKRRAIPTSTDSGTGPDRPIDNTGNSATLISLTVGSFASAGSLARAASTFTRTSASALSALKPASNSSITEAWPSLATEVIFLMPSSERNSCSIGRTSNRSPSSGLMPSSDIDTYIIGMATSGLASFGITR